LVENQEELKKKKAIKKLLGLSEKERIPNNLKGLKKNLFLMKKGKYG